MLHSERQQQRFVYLVMPPITMTQPLARLVLFLLVLMPGMLSAHPHNWISVKSEFTVNEEGELVSIQQDWTFDTFYSVIKLEEIAIDYPSQQLGLEETAEVMAKNLLAFGYFSELLVDGQPIDLPYPDNSMLSLVNEEAQQRLMLTMNFTLTIPKKLTDLAVLWRVYDPTYYIEMKHHQASRIVIDNMSSAQCSTTLDAPEVTDELIEYAASLDRTQKNTQGLGSLFAETILIRCL